MVFLAFAFSLVVLSDFYDGFFAVVALGSFITYRAIQAFWPKKSITFNWNTLKTYVLTSALILLMILPFTFNILKLTVESRLSIRPSTNSAFYGRSMTDLNAFSARPWEYVVPFALNPIFGKHTYSFLEQRIHGSNFTEQSIFLGFIPMVLAFCAVVQWSSRKKRNRADQFNKAVLVTPIFAWIAFIAVLFSFPPLFSIFGYNVRLPSFFTLKFLPMFRAYARFSVIVLLAVAVLAGIGLTWILEKTRNWRQGYSFLLISVIILLIAAEFTNIPPFAVADVSGSPPEYNWLAKQPGDFIIAEYPLVPYDFVEHSEYLFYQRIHKKRLINGAVGDIRAEEFRQKVLDISNADTPKILSQKKVKYVVVHNEKFQPPDRPNINSPVLEKTKQFGDTVIYKIENKPAESAILGR